MLAAERRSLLLTRLHQDGKLVARDLAAELGLSEHSLRRDLRELAAAGLCQRVYGGALPVSPATGEFAARLGVAPESKRRVAARAAQLIAPGSTVILGGGTTAHAVAAALPHKLSAMIVTPTPVTAALLVEHPTVDVFVLGGRLAKESASVCGAASADASSEKLGTVAAFSVIGLSGVAGVITDADSTHPTVRALRKRKVPVLHAP